MEELFLKTLNMSITATYVLAAVIVLRIILKRAPKWISYALWSLVLFRLVCPVSISSAFSIFGRIGTVASTGGEMEHIPADIGMVSIPQVDISTPSINTVINNALPAATPVTSINPMQILIFIGACIWLAGIGVMLIYSVVSYLRLKHRLSEATLVSENIYEIDKISSPFVCGLVKPKIYLPVGLSGNEREYVLYHEKTHISRRDYLIKPLAFLALSVHWFNPFMWLAFFLMSRDIEMSCDEKVVSGLDSEGKAGYSSALMQLAMKRPILAGSPLAFGESGAKGRIKNVLNYKKPAAWIIAVSVVLVVTLIVVFATNGAIDRTDPEGYKALFKERFAEAYTVGLHYTAAVTRNEKDADVTFSENGVDYYKCDHYDSRDELRSATLAIFTDEYAQGFYPRHESEAFLERGGGLYIAPWYLFDVSVWQSEDTITSEGKTVDTFLWDTLTVTSADGSKISYTLDWYQYYPADPLTSAFSLVKGADSVWRFDECFGDSRKTPEMAFIELQTFISEDTDLVKLGKFAFTTYMDYLSSEGMPVEERIASYKLNEISVLAGDINEFCVALNYDITTDSDNYLNPALGAKGKGTWPDNYLEIRVKNNGNNVYEIKDVGTGGGAQGLTPLYPNSSPQQQIFDYIAHRMDSSFAPYYTNMHYEMTGYEETISGSEYTGTFLWTHYFISYIYYDVPSDIGKEQQANYSFQTTAKISADGVLDSDTITVLADTAAVGPPQYTQPLDDFFKNLPSIEFVITNEGAVDQSSIIVPVIDGEDMVDTVTRWAYKWRQAVLSLPESSDCHVLDFQITEVSYDPDNANFPDEPEVYIIRYMVNPDYRSDGFTPWIAGAGVEIESGEYKGWISQGGGIWLYVEDGFWHTDGMFTGR